MHALSRNEFEDAVTVASDNRDFWSQLRTYCWDCRPKLTRRQQLAELKKPDQQRRSHQPIRGLCYVDVLALAFLIELQMPLDIVAEVQGRKPKDLIAGIRRATRLLGTLSCPSSSSTESTAQNELLTIPPSGFGFAAIASRAVLRSVSRGQRLLF